MQHMRRCRTEVGSDVALRCAGRVCISFAWKRRRVSQAAVPGTAGPGGAVASTEAPAPRGGHGDHKVVRPTRIRAPESR
ncbi:hypothetical protein SHIRM173S_02960 [Streptomyces hirsutus]